jgi:hypothetical protein
MEIFQKISVDMLFVLIDGGSYTLPSSSGTDRLIIELQDLSIYDMSQILYKISKRMSDTLENI